MQHKISTLPFEAKFGDYNYPVVQHQKFFPQAHQPHYYPQFQQQQFIPSPANSRGLLTILPAQQSPESYSSCSSFSNTPTPAQSTTTTTDEDQVVDHFLTQLQIPGSHTSQ